MSNLLHENCSLENNTDCEACYITSLLGEVQHHLISVNPCNIDIESSCQNLIEVIDWINKR